jgi:hypothetical protein
MWAFSSFYSKTHKEQGVMHTMGPAMGKQAYASINLQKDKNQRPEQSHGSF